MSRMDMENSSSAGSGNEYMPAQWSDFNGYGSHNQSPAQEYNGFNFVHASQSISAETAYSHIDPPTQVTHQQLRPLVVPPWPSMLTSQSTYTPPVVPTAPSATPISSTSTHSSHSTSSPRRTLTDADRRKMCIYHEENPTIKQTEIGAMFGVERSTVSKVLRQKEKYLFPDDGSRSPIKRSKGKFPDIERALSNWARNSQRHGLKLSDRQILDKAKFFARTVGNIDHAEKINSTNWLEKFKVKNNLTGAKSSKKSVGAIDSDGGDPNDARSATQTPSGISPSSPSGILSPSPMSATKSQDSVKTESPDAYIDFNGYKLPNSQSTTSLSSVFTDTAPSSYSAGPQTPTSPFFTPDSACAAGSFLTSQQSRLPPPNSNNSRPRSQTFPMLGVEPAYISPPPSTEPLTPRYMDQSAAAPTAPEASMSEMHRRLSMSENVSPPPPTQTSHTPVTSSPASSMPPPPTVPAASANICRSPTQDDARRALELVMNFFQHQPSGLVDPQEYITIGKLMEKLRLHGRSLSGGMHHIRDQDMLTQTPRTMEPSRV
ncbi:MAG: hypothetical protein M1833_005875 [Piccolia ochrophora]|nr:MAG: hypothetical protein M1833_005875 [Piccolia ochrophora]